MEIWIQYTLYGYWMLVTLITLSNLIGCLIDPYFEPQKYMIWATRIWFLILPAVIIWFGHGVIHAY